MKPSVLLLYFDNGLSEETKFNRRTAIDVYNALSIKQYPVTLFQVKKSNWHQSLTMPGELVFNFAEDKSYDLYRKIAQGLTALGRPQFAVNMKMFDLTVNKDIIRDILFENHIPIPKYTTNSNVGDLKYPLIVKPAATHSSVGINQHSVVVNEKQLRRRVNHVRNRFGKVVVEEFILGRELNVTVLGNNNIFTLPYCELVFHGECNKWKIFSYQSKWAALSGKESCETGRDVICPAPLSVELKQKIEKVILKTYKVLGFVDMARIDFRLTDNGDIYIFDANNSPSISSINCFDANALNWSYEDFIEVLVGIYYKRVYETTS